MRELQLSSLQKTIDRLSFYSFAVELGSILLILATLKQSNIFGEYLYDSDALFLFFGLITYFWSAYYLYVERLFKEKYDLAIQGKEDADFNVTKLRSVKKFWKALSARIFFPYWILYTVIIVIRLCI
jgi:hypothetical protein